MGEGFGIIAWTKLEVQPGIVNHVAFTVKVVFLEFLVEVNLHPFAVSPFHILDGQIFRNTHELSWHQVEWAHFQRDGSKVIDKRLRENLQLAILSDIPILFFAVIKFLEERNFYPIMRFMVKLHFLFIVERQHSPFEFVIQVRLNWFSGTDCEVSLGIFDLRHKLEVWISGQSFICILEIESYNLWKKLEPLI